MHIGLSGWRDGHYVGLAELLAALGRITADASWELRIDEAAPGPEGAAIEALAQRPRVSTRDLILAAFPDGQIIDGELRGYAHLLQEVVPATAHRPDIVVRAIDGNWEIECATADLHAAVMAALPDSRDVTGLHHVTSPAEI
ncbi:hypothetical protein [Polymorphospora sp. NPDC050346]|uniref:hypothetical protein n=1 Tax=Polymorphospora sp. NPDC050346 TaxID=3155780 RepID=UPI0033F97B17